MAREGKALREVFGRLEVESEPDLGVFAGITLRDIAKAKAIAEAATEIADSRALAYSEALRLLIGALRGWKERHEKPTL